MFAEVREDVRYGWRLIRKHPLLSCALVATLSLGIGLDAGVFTLINGMLFRARVEEHPETFVQVDVQYAGAGIAEEASALPIVSARDFAAYRDGSRSLSPVAAWRPVHATLSGDADAAASTAVPLLVTCDFFDVYGDAQLIAGRLFRPEDCGQPGASPVAVVAEELWRTRFGGDDRIVGRAISLNGFDFTVVGIIKAGFAGQLRGPIWIPYTMQARFYAGRDLFREPKVPWLIMIGRLRPGVSRAVASAELNVLARQQDRLEPGRTSTIRLTNGSLIEMPGVRTQAFWIVPLVMGALSLVLLIACANVTMLLLSRAAARRHEIAVRITLGATRGRLLRMLLTEGVLLALAAGPLSALIANEVPVVFKSRIPLMPYYPVHFDAATFAYMAAMTFLAGGLAVVAPALESLKHAVSDALGRHDVLSSGRWRWRTSDAFVAGQVAMSLVLLVAAALFVRGEFALRTADSGYDTRQILVATPRVGVPPYTRESAAVFYRTLAVRVRALAGVRAVSFASVPPLADSESGMPNTVVTAVGQNTRATAIVNSVTPDYFRTLGITLLRGRAAAEGDGAAAIVPVVVSEALARALVRNGDPLGELLEDSRRRTLQIVGVARDMKSSFGAAATSIVYTPRADGSGGAMLIRFSGDAAAAAHAVREVIQALDHDAAVEPRTLASVHDDLADRFLRLVGMVGFLGIVAIGLAAIGIYSVAAFAASRRIREMGIRIALGATRADILVLVLWAGVRPIAAGLLVGLTLAIVASVALQQVFAQAPIAIDLRDPATYAAAAAILAALALAAMLGPARRAASADPMYALRQE